MTKLTAKNTIFLFLAALHLYLAWDHMQPLFMSGYKFIHFWKGFGALAGAVYFTAAVIIKPR
mgnify:CR=1 FL=1